MNKHLIIAELLNCADELDTQNYINEANILTKIAQQVIEIEESPNDVSQPTDIDFININEQKNSPIEQQFINLLVEFKKQMKEHGDYLYENEAKKQIHEFQTKWRELQYKANSFVSPDDVEKWINN